MTDFYAAVDSQAVFAFALLFGASYGVVSILKPVVMAEVLGRRAFGKIAGFMAAPFLIAAAVAPQAGALLLRADGHDLALVVAPGMAALAFGFENQGARK